MYSVARSLDGSSESASAPASPIGTASATTPTPMMTEFSKPSINRALPNSSENQLVVKHSQGITRGKREELNAVIVMMISGPNRKLKKAMA